MSNKFFNDLKESSNAATLGITDDISTIAEGFKKLSVNSSKFSKDLINTTNSVTKLQTALTGAVQKAGAIGTIGLGFVSLATNIGTVVSLLEEVKNATKEFKGVSQGLTFAEAISGSKQLEQNLSFIKQVTGDFNKLELSLKSLFDPSGTTKFVSASVKAYADVEQAAYRLSTITVSGNERSISALNKNIEVMRSLQKETNFAIDSVSLLNTQYDIASAGFTSRKDQQDVGKASVNLSQAGFGDVAGSTNAVVRVLKALDEGSGSAERRAAQLFETTKVGLVTLDQLTSEVGILSVQSKQLGVDFEEVSAALAGLTTKGVSASESNTKLTAFFNEIVAGSDEANRVLANFRDSAGKPIQINAANLRQKGIKGIVEDLKTATNGDVGVLQQIFSSKEAQEAAQLLISLGGTFEEFTSKIKNVDTSTFAEESANRAKTLSGAYNKAFNESQKAVEDFGSGFGEQAIESLGAVGEVATKAANSGAEGFGKLSGTLVGISSKIQAVGGFLLSAFTIVAPIVLFKTITSKAGELIAKFKEFKKEGETPWEAIKRAGLLTIDSIRTNFVSGIRSIIGEIFGIEEALNKVAKTQSKKQTQKTKSSNVKEDVIDVEFETVENLNNKRLNSGTKALPGSNNTNLKALPSSRSIANESTIVNASSSGLANIRRGDLATSNPSNISNVSRIKPKKIVPIEVIDLNSSNNISKVTTKTSALEKGLNTITNGFGKAREGVTKFATSQVGGFIGKTIGQLGALGSGLALASAALEIGTGWLDTFGKIGNKSTIPALQDLRESLLDIKNVDGIKKIVSDLDPVTSKIQESNIYVATFNETLSELGRYWNEATGKATQYRIAAEEIDNAVSILNTEIQSDLEKASQGKTSAKTVAAQNAENKLSLGIDLNTEDRATLDAEVNNSIAKVNARVAALRNKAKAAQGNVNQDEQQRLNDEAKAAENTKDEEIKKIRNSSNQRELQQLVSRFNKTDTSISLAADLRIENRTAFKAQIDSIATDLNDAISGKLSDPEKFQVLKNNIESAFKSLEITAAIDPEEAIRQRDQLISTIGEDNFNKLLKNNPASRIQATASNTAITSAANKNEQNKLSSRNSLLESSESLGSTSGLLGFEKSQNTVKSLNSQISNLNKELKRPETTLARQAEILAEISQLESQRVASEVEGKIKLQLNVRKQELTISEQLISIEQTKVNLYSQENKFGSLAITQAQAKLDASNKELKLKKEQLDITAKEELIKKQAILSSLQKTKIESAAKSEPSKSTVSSQIDQVKSDSNTAVLEKIKVEAEKAKQAAKTNLDKTVQENNISNSTFTSEQRKAISDTVASAISQDKSTKSFLDANLGEGSAESVFNKSRGRRSGRTINPERIEALLFDESGKSKIDTKALQSQLAKSQGVGNKGFAELFETNLDRDANGKLKTNSNLNAQKVYEDTIRNIDSTLTKDLEKQELKIKENKILGGVGGKLQSSNVNPKIVSEAKQDLANTQIKNDLAKLSLDYETAVKNITLTLDKEFVVREKTLKNSTAIADSFNKLSSNSEIFGDSIVSASLALSAFKIADNDKRLDLDAERAKKDIDARIKVDEENLDKLNQSLAEAYKKGASTKVINSIKEDINTRTKTLDSAKSERVQDRKNIDLQTALAKNNNSIEENALNLRLRSRNRELDRTSSTDVSSSLSNLSSNLSSTLSKIAPNNQVSSQIDTADAIQKALTARETRSITRNNTLDQLNARIDATTKTLDTARNNGASGEVISRLENARNLAVKEADVTNRNLSQQQALDDANDKLTVFASLLDTNNSKISETIDTMNKQVSVIKDSLDLQQRQNDLASESNKSTTGLQSSLFGFLGKNNPLTSILQQRLDVSQNNDDAISQKAKNVNDAKKELLDINIQKAQLDLEQQAFENALTQTALLSDILNVSQGGQSQLSGEGFIQDSLSKLSDNFNRTRELNSNRISLLDKKQGFIETELNVKNQNIDKDTAAKNLNTLGSNLRPANFDLIAKSINDTESLLKGSNRQKIDVGSLNDPEFKSQLKNLNNLTANTRETIAASTKANKPSNNSQGNNSPKVNISAPVSLNINVSGDTGGSNYDSNLRDYVGKSVNSGLSKLTRELENRLK